MRRVLRRGGRAAAHRPVPRPPAGRRDRAHALRRALRPARPARALLHPPLARRARWTHAGFEPVAMRAGAAMLRSLAPRALAAADRARRDDDVGDALRRARVEVVARPGRRCSAPFGSLSAFEPQPPEPAPRSPGWRARGRPPARARARLRAAGCRAACSIAARSNSGSTASGLRSWAIRAIDAAAGSCALVEPLERGVLRRARSAPAAARSRRATRREQRRTSAAARDAQPGRGRARRLGAAACEPLAQRRARRDPARAEQRRHDVAGHEPGPVDRRVDAEDDHDDGAASRAPTRSASQGSPRSRRRRPTVRAAADSHAPAASSESAEPDPAEVGERLHDVAVGVADRRGRRCGSAGAACRRSPRRCRATGSLAWTSSASRQ